MRELAHFGHETVKSLVKNFFAGLCPGRPPPHHDPRRSRDGGRHPRGVVLSRWGQNTKEALRKSLKPAFKPPILLGGLTAPRTPLAPARGHPLTRVPRRRRAARAAPAAPHLHHNLSKTLIITAPSPDIRTIRREKKMGSSPPPRARTI